MKHIPVMESGQIGKDIPTYSLNEKTLIRIDLDPNLERAWDFEKKSGIGTAGHR